MPRDNPPFGGCAIPPAVALPPCWRSSVLDEEDSMSKEKKDKEKKAAVAAPEERSPRPEIPLEASISAKRITNKEYLAELATLQIELVKLQEWIKHKKLKVVAIFEGRDAAGKGAPSSASPKPSTLASPAWWRCPRPPSARKPSGTSSAMWSNCRPAARWC
jgi:hypothetical protein